MNKQWLHNIQSLAMYSTMITFKLKKKFQSLLLGCIETSCLGICLLLHPEVVAFLHTKLASCATLFFTILKNFFLVSAGKSLSWAPLLSPWFRPHQLSPLYIIFLRKSIWKTNALRTSADENVFINCLPGSKMI